MATPFNKMSPGQKFYRLMSDHETTLRSQAVYWLELSNRTTGDMRTSAEFHAKYAACLAGAETLRREKEIAEAVHYYTGEDVDELVQRYRDEGYADH